MNTDYSDQNQATGARGEEPLFLVSLALEDDNEIPEHEIQKFEIDDFVLPPRGPSKVSDFDPIAHLKLEEVRDEEEEDYDDGAEAPDPVFEPIY